jgi:hypothetical protein
VNTPDNTPDDNTFDDDVRFARARLGPADPAARPTTALTTADARDQLAWRLAPVAAGAPAYGGGGAAGAGAMVTALPVRRRPSRWLAVPIAAVVALVLGLLVLQPFARSTPAGAAALRAAAQTTAAEGTARVSATIAALGQSVTVAGVGDLSSGDGRLTVDAPPPLGSAEVLHVGDDLWVSAPALVGDMLGSDTWLHADAATLAEALGETGMTGFDLSFALDPVKAVDYVRSVSGDVTEVGTETVQGEETTHYSTHLDPAKLADLAGDDASRDALDQAVTAVNQEIPVDLWIDDAGRLRKVTVSVDLDLLQLPEGTDTRGATLEGPLTATFELSDFGTPLDTTPPPADQVTEVGPLLAMLTRGGR